MSAFSRTTRFRILFIALLIVAATAGAAEARNQCWRGWHAHAEVAGEWGVNLLHGGAGSRLQIWRMLELGEAMPEQPVYVPYAQRKQIKDAREELQERSTALNLDWRARLGPNGGSGRIYPNYGFARELLQEREALLGAEHPYIRAWLDRQWVVFANAGWEPRPPLPPEEGLSQDGAIFPGAAAALSADDLRYQQAASRFYALAFAEAAVAFAAIAEDRGSRYRPLAAYMVARSLAYDGQLAASLAQIAAIEADPSLRDSWAMAEQVPAFIAWHFRAEGELTAAVREAELRVARRIARVLAMPAAAINADPDLKSEFQRATDDLSQYFLRASPAGDRRLEGLGEDWWLADANGELPAQLTGYIRALAVAAGDTDLLDWLQATESAAMLARSPWRGYFGARAEEKDVARVTEHVAQRFAETRKLTWALALAMRTSRPTEGLRNYLRAEAESIEARLADCSATTMDQMVRGALRYHLDRWSLIERWTQQREIDWPTFRASTSPGLREEAVRYLITAGADPQEFSVSDVTSLPLRLLLSRSFEDFAAIVGRSSYVGDPVINLLPVRYLIALMGDPRLERYERGALARMAWVRAFLLEDEALLREISPQLAELNPSIADLVAIYQAQRGAVDRRKMGLLLLLQVPAMQANIEQERRYITIGYTGGNYGYWSWLAPAPSGDAKAPDLFWADAANPNDGNWWCRADPWALQEAVQARFVEAALLLYPGGDWNLGQGGRGNDRWSAARLRDLMRGHPVLKLIDWEEIGRLSKVAAAPEYLTRGVLDWVRQASWLERWIRGDEMARALALAIRAGRYGCTRDRAGEGLSYAAFALLHAHFPDSEDAKHVKYWYK